MGIEPKAVFLTGYPFSVIARRVLEKVLTDANSPRIICATLSAAMPAARAHLSRFPSWSARVELRPYDITAMDFGLSGQDFYQLAQEVGTIHHCASTIRAGQSSSATEDAGVRAAGEVLELAKSASSVERVVFWSSALVSGSRQGVVMEDDLIRPSSFRTAIEKGLFRAERLMREAVKQIPITVLRPSFLIGSSHNGETEPFEEPHLLIQFILNAPPDLPMLLPKKGEVPLHLVPVDFVVEAGWAITHDQSSVGRTFHLVDPNPSKVNEVVQSVCKAIGKTYQIGELPKPLATALIRAPGLRRWFEMPRALLEQLATNVVYDTSNSSKILQPRHIACPPLSSYLDSIIERAKKAL